jgi:hypothetical protein
VRLRRLLLCSVVIGLTATTAPVALAAKPKPRPTVCYLLVDQEGDGKAAAAGSVKSPMMDILSADIASGAKTVVGVLRVKTTKADSSDPVGMLGVRWYLNFQVQGVNYSLTYRRSPGASDAYTGNAMTTDDGRNIAVPATIVGNTIVWTIQRADVPGLKKVNTYIQKITASTSPVVSNGDAADTQKKYLDKTPSCVKAA